MSAVKENPGGDSKSDDVFMPKKGGHSTVWNFVGFRPDDDAEGVRICKQCFGIVTALQGSTPNLYNHL